ncbi:MAG: hypothetical protein SFV22_11405 [Saprospiraceae bacterium]|nr:hypothetical protein [Saprospiraceae bacterium]
MSSILRICALLFLAASLLLGTQCRRLPPQSESVCLGPGRDGTILVKAYGYGANNRAATKAALKNAIQDALFKGTPAGKPGCPSRPIVKDISKRDSPYFKEFFKKNGAYLQFINLTGDGNLERTKVRRWVKVGVDAVIDHRRLRDQMVKDKQAASLNDGF